MTNAKTIAKTMLKEFAQKYGAGWHLITATHEESTQP